MPSGKRDSFLNSQAEDNPFDMLQTIDVKDNNNTNDNSNPFGLARPKSSTKRTKSKDKKRPSEPARTITQQTQAAQNKPQNNNINAGGDDLLSFFGSVSADNTPNKPSNNPNIDDPFGVFSSNTAGATTTNNDRPNFSDNNSLQAPNVGNDPRSSVNSVVTGELVDWNMFDVGGKQDDPFAGFDMLMQESNKGSSQLESPGQGPERTKKARSVLVPTQAEKKKIHQNVAQPTGGALAEGNESGESETTSESESESDGGNEKNNSDNKNNNNQTKDGKHKSRKNKDKDTKTPTPEQLAKRRASAPSVDQGTKKTNAIEELRRGTALLKYPRRHGFPHFKHVQLSRDNQRLQWFSKRKGLNDTCIWLKDVKEIVQGQETEVFKKFHQKALEKASFSVVHGTAYKTLDLVAKSTDECEMWVRALQQLHRMIKEGKDVSKIDTLDVGVKFRDRNRPKSRRGSGNFVRANNSKHLKIDPEALKQIERDMEMLLKTFQRVSQLAQRDAITQKSDEFHNIQQVLSELEERSNKI